ncbi:MAG: NAD(P)-dependent oxidoreductase [Rhizobiaceae bacterium]|nr:NAD(P)-dependent oxidoreductase [Rhizobiaceae bacterium]
MTARSTKMRRCGWIGIGTMGNPLSRRLMSAGFELRGYDPDPGAMERIVAAGATAAESPAMVAEMADVVFSMVPNDNILLDIVSGPDGIARTIRPGSVHVDLSTVSPEASARVAEVMSGTGAAYLRCPVSGSTSNAESGSLTLLVSGPEDAVEDLSAILSVFGENRLYFGAGEEARIVKLMINMMVGVMPALIGEAVEFGVRQGLPRDTAIEAINNSVAATPLGRYKSDMLKSEDWSPMATTDLVAKDMDLAMAIGRDQHIPLTLTTMVRQYYAMLQAGGDGGNDFFKVSTWPKWGGKDD